MDKNQIINGDSLEILKTIKEKSIDLIFADPPYWMRIDGVLKRSDNTDFSGCNDEWDNQFKSNEDYEKFTEQWLTECKRVLKDNGSIWVIGGMQCIYTIGGIMQKLGFWLINDVIWHKKNPTPNFKGTRLNNSHETLIWATKSKKSKFTFNYKTAKELNCDNVTEEEFMNNIRKQMGSVWRIAVCQGNERLKDENGKKLHNTQKPEELLYRIINISSKIGDIVLDPFAGTMTTGAVAKKTGRNYIMIERDKNYCNFGQNRITFIMPIIKDIENSVFDKKIERASIKEMIESGVLTIGETLYLKTNSWGVLTKEGKVDYNNSGELLDIHNGATKALGRKGKVNGYDYWQVMRNGKLFDIKGLRELTKKEHCLMSIEKKVN